MSHPRFPQHRFCGSALLASNKDSRTYQISAVPVPQQVSPYSRCFGAYVAEPNEPRTQHSPELRLWITLSITELAKDEMDPTGETTGVAG